MNHIINSGYSGYDPYDGSNTNSPLIINYKYTRAFSTYLNKFSPINFRKLLGIKPSKQNQALAFIGRAMLFAPDEYQHEIADIANTLVNSSMKKEYGYHCWDAHGFPIQMLSGYHPAGKPDIFGTESIARFFLELHDKDPKPIYREICESVCNFFINDLAVVNSGKHFFKYEHTTSEDKCCYNVSVTAANYILDINNTFSSSFEEEFPKKCITDVVERQKENGEWYYSYDLADDYEKPQIDFHQGYILDVLLNLLKNHNGNESIKSAYKKGLEYYYEKQFLPTGQGIYRYPKKWPVNIHNQAQGIITFARAAREDFGGQYSEFALQIAEWTIDKMQSSRGYFYYHKYPMFTNKIPYIRWSDAAMAYALGELMNNK